MPVRPKPGIMISLQQVKQVLVIHYSAPLWIAFRQFRNGAIYFTVGLTSVLMANAYMTPSVLQEVVVLAGMLLGACGFFLAMMGQTRLLLSRLFQFARKKD